MRGCLPLAKKPCNRMAIVREIDLAVFRLKLDKRVIREPNQRATRHAKKAGRLSVNPSSLNGATIDPGDVVRQCNVVHIGDIPDTPKTPRYMCIRSLNHESLVSQSQNGVGYLPRAFLPAF